MSEMAVQNGSQVTWFVGAAYDIVDQTPRFLAEGIWENGYDNRYLDLVRSMRAGERIAIKSSYTRKHGLPFDNRGQTVSVMTIKAIGTITENLNDGRHVRVNWTKLEPGREWYFYTHRGTVWRVLPGDWTSDGLIAFAFNSRPQDIDRFRSAPSWRERFGPVALDKQRFKWTSFYEAIADKLLPFRSNRASLIDGLRQISSRVDGLGYLAGDRYADGATGFVKDICPFTTMGMFNRGITDANRKIIAAELAEFLGVREVVPETFEGIPLLNNLKSWYFPFEISRPVDHIDALWDAFVTAIQFADSQDREDDARVGFANIRRSTMQMAVRELLGT
jgi:5-methylcytosine-specific restriction protein B